jgi:hypothetical protein
LRRGFHDYAFRECSEMSGHLRGSLAVEMMRSISTVAAPRFGEALRGKGVEVLALDVTSHAEVEEGIKSLLARAGDELDMVI